MVFIHKLHSIITTCSGFLICEIKNFHITIIVQLYKVIKVKSEESMSFMCIDLKVKQVEESIILGQDDNIKTLVPLPLGTNQNEILQEVTKLKQLTD